MGRILANVETVIEGQRRALRLVTAVLAAGGHSLLEAGTGKTTLAKALAISVGLEFKRVQFTPGPAALGPHRGLDLRPAREPLPLPPGAEAVEEIAEHGALPG